MSLEILYEDKHLMAINKPNGLLVHATKIAKYADTNVLKELCEIEHRPYFTIHRLDRKTSGVLLIALTKETQSKMSKLFHDRNIKKTYQAIVRGYIEQEGVIDYAIKNDKGILKSAFTSYRLIEHLEIPFSLGKHKTCRYSIVELKPETGRYHQLRMHMSHIFHPIIGDRPHGCNKQNRFFKEKFDMTSMLLHAQEIEFEHPITKKRIYINAPFPPEYTRMLQLLRNEKG